MTDPLIQRFNFAIIDLYKNYSDLSSKIDLEQYTHTRTHPGFGHVAIAPSSLIKIDVFGSTEYDYVVNHSRDTKHIIKNTKAIYGCDLHELPLAERIITTDSEVIKKYYGSPFAGVSTYLIERSVKLKGDKLIIKIYLNNKKRFPQTKFYKKNKEMYILSINLKNGNILTITDDKLTKQFRVNHFNLLEFKLKKILQLDVIETIKYEKAKNIFEEVFITKDVYQKIASILNENSYIENEKDLSELILKFFINRKKIKAPNEYQNFFKKSYPTEKYLKRNGRKLVQSILDAYDIKSKITNKILHQYPDINVFNFALICQLFGAEYPKYVAMINIKLLDVKDDYFTGDGFSTKLTKYSNIRQEIRNITLKFNDKEKILKLLNSAPCQFSIILDHLKMLHQIRQYDDNKLMNFNSYDEFINEHNEFSKIISQIKKGYTIEYQFNRDMIDDVEKEIEVKINIGDKKNPKYETIKFYPIILKREEEYVDEGTFMHHCVASYADRETSVIISLRTEDGKDRITCEFDAQRGNCLQARHFCNGAIPGDFDLALDTLKEKTLFFARRGMFHYTHKKRVPVKINNKEVEPPQIVVQLNQNLFP